MKLYLHKQFTENMEMSIYALIFHVKLVASGKSCVRPLKCWIPEFSSSEINLAL